jgi:hypothetical protein
MGLGDGRHASHAGSKVLECFGQGVDSRAYCRCFVVSPNPDSSSGKRRGEGDRTKDQKVEIRSSMRSTQFLTKLKVFEKSRDGYGPARPGHFKSDKLRSVRESVCVYVWARSGQRKTPRATVSPMSSGNGQSCRRGEFPRSDWGRCLHALHES